MLTPSSKPSSHFCFLQPEGCELVLSAEAAQNRFDVDGFLRADLAEHSRAGDADFVWYFNLGMTTHQLRQRYGMVPVLRPGRRASSVDAEVLPLLDGQSVLRFRCAAILWYPRFPQRLGDEVLLNSLLGDKTLSGLRQALLHRYAASQGGLDDEAILAKGVSATLLERVR